MNSLKKDYTKLYLLQNKFLAWWTTLKLPFYLTGGTALGRFYLNHRYSEDLDFFVNADSNYTNYITMIRNEISSHFKINIETALFSDDFTRFIITDNETFLKIEFVNDIGYRCGEVKKYDFGLIDTPLNILSNKLTALIGRDEAKDVFDILTIALNYNFNWIRIFQDAKTKTIINEIDVEERLSSFPIEWLENVDWLPAPVNFEIFKQSLKTLADDFLLGKDNSLCSGKDFKIENAVLRT
jgi:hypothetical protein